MQTLNYKQMVLIAKSKVVNQLLFVDPDKYKIWNQNGLIVFHRCSHDRGGVIAEFIQSSIAKEDNMA